jgi:hypothetical protein
MSSMAFLSEQYNLITCLYCFTNSDMLFIIVFCTVYHSMALLYTTKLTADCLGTPSGEDSFIGEQQFQVFSKVNHCSTYL